MARLSLPPVSLSSIIKKIKQLFKWSFNQSAKIGIFILLATFLLKNDLSFQFYLNTGNDQLLAPETIESFSIFEPFSNLFEGRKDSNEIAHQPFSPASNDYSNMTYHEGAKNVSGLGVSGAEKIKNQQNYLTRFVEVAKSEMKKYGIPASIILAQGLIESNAGDSPLAKENNNHFGIKCFSKSCHKGHCSNFSDDSHKDFFRKYATAWESFRAHSILLGGERYLHLKKLKKTDYKGWAHGLQKAGYATDKRYAEKLIHIIEEMELYRFDN